MRWCATEIEARAILNDNKKEGGKQRKERKRTFPPAGEEKKHLTQNIVKIVV